MGPPYTLFEHRLIIVRFSIGKISDLDFSRNFIQQRFKSQDKTKNREITTFETTATDTDLVRNVLDTVKSNLLRAIMKDMGFTNS